MKFKKEKKLNINIKFLITIVFLLLVSGCNKNSISNEDFTKKMKKMGYSVTNISSDNNITILSVGDNFQVFYYQYEKVAEAKKQLKKEIKQYEDDNVKIKKESVSNHDKYEIESENIYTIYYRIDNTYIFISSLKENKSDVIKILNKLGYI